MFRFARLNLNNDEISSDAESGLPERIENIGHIPVQAFASAEVAAWGLGQVSVNLWPPRRFDDIWLCWPSVILLL